MSKKTVTYSLSDENLKASLQSLQGWLNTQADGEIALQALMLVGYAMVFDTPDKSASLTFTDAVISLKVELRGPLQ